MSLKNTLLQEIEREAANTKRMLERVPADKFDWKPHEKSMSMKQLASHIASIYDWTPFVLKNDVLDFQNDNRKKHEVTSVADLTSIIDEALAATKEAMNSIKDEDLDQEWTMKSGEQIFMQLPKSLAIRNLAMNHLYHHRGQMSVYLRLLDIPVPGMYGQSADDKA